MLKTRRKKKDATTPLIDALIEASRLLGWIRSPQEAAEEMDIDFETARKHLHSNRVFVASEYKLLTA